MTRKTGFVSLVLLLLLPFLRGVHSTTETSGDSAVGPVSCCPEHVALSTVRCDDGSPLNLRNCTKYIIEPEYDAFEIYKNGTLLYDNNTESFFTIDRENYCIAQRTGQPVAIVCLPENFLSENNGTSIRALCELISVIFIISTIIVYAILPVLRDLQGKCILNFLVGLAISFLVLAIMQHFAADNGYCEFLAFIIYYSFMISFFWLNVISFHIWKTTVHPTILGTEKQWYAMYLIYAYSAPTCFLIAILITHYTPGDHVKPGFGELSCWFSDKMSTWLYFYGPISILLVINILLFLWSSISLWKDSEQLRETKLRSKRYRLMLCVKLFFIMGLLWVFEILSYALGDEDPGVFWTITDYVNALQGVLIFLLLVVFRKRAIRGLAKRGLLCFQFPQTWKTLVDEESEGLCEDDGEHHLRTKNTQIENS